jgi:hypothetical protein
MPVPSINVFDPFVRLLRRGRAFRAAARTRRILADLPPSIRKDIGWPDCLDEPPQRGR